MRTTISRSATRIAALAVLPALLGAKCIEYQPLVATDGGALADADPAAADADPAASDARGLDATVVTPAVPCERADEAQLRVENFQYIIQCGCAETEGSSCTVAAGTTVVWLFADSQEHNVSSIANRFGMSADLLAGSFSYQFTASGDYVYGCSIHAEVMSGFKIAVR